MCRYMVNQYVIVPKLYSVSINTILVTFITVKVSQNLNLMRQNSEINNLVGGGFQSS